MFVIDEVSCLMILGQMSDRVAVFHHVFALVKVGQKELMTCGNITRETNHPSVNRYLFSLPQRLDSDSHIVCRVYLDGLHNDIVLIYYFIHGHVVWFVRHFVYKLMRKADTDGMASQLR